MINGSRTSQRTLHHKRRFLSSRPSSSATRFAPLSLSAGLTGAFFFTTTPFINDRMSFLTAFAGGPASFLTGGFDVDGPAAIWGSAAATASAARLDLALGGSQYKC